MDLRFLKGKRKVEWSGVECGRIIEFVIIISVEISDKIVCCLISSSSNNDMCIIVYIKFVKKLDGITVFCNSCCKRMNIYNLESHTDSRFEKLFQNCHHPFIHTIYLF